MDKKRFVKAIYKAATPSINYDEVNKIIPWEYTLPRNVYEGILLAMGVEYGSDEMCWCDMFMIGDGPTLIE